VPVLSPSVRPSRPAKLTRRLRAERRKQTVPPVQTRSKATPQLTPGRSLKWLLPVALLSALGVALLWVGELTIRRPGTNPAVNSNPTEASKPPVNPEEAQQRDLVNAADEDIANRNLEAAMSKLEQAKKLTGPLDQGIAQRLVQVERGIRDAALALLLQQEGNLWIQAKEKTDAARFTEAQQDLRAILDMPPGGRRKDDARKYLDQVIPQRQREEQLFAEARQAMGRKDTNSLKMAADLLVQVISFGGPRQQESQQLLNEVQQAQRNLGIAGLVESARGDVKRGDFGLARQRVVQIQQMGGDPAPLSAEINQAEQARFAQLEASLNQFKQSDDVDAVQRLQDLQPQLQALADGRGPTANEARRDAASIPEVIHQKQLLTENRAAEVAYQQALQRYQRANDTTALTASRGEFQSIARGGGPRAGDAQKFIVAEIDPKIAELSASAAGVKPANPAVGPPVVKSDEVEKAAVHVVVQQYADAFQQRDADAVRKIWPYMSKAEYDGSKQSFGYASAIRMNLSNEKVDVAPDGTTATVTVDIAQDFTPKGGKVPLKQVDHTVFHLVKQNNGTWVIKDRK
jgi:hypothetical protein